MLVKERASGSYMFVRANIELKKKKPAGPPQCIDLKCAVMRYDLTYVAFSPTSVS